MAVLDSGIAAATACRDTYLMVNMLSEKANRYVYVEKDYKKAIEAHLRAIAIREDEGLCYSLGIAMGLQGMIRLLTIWTEALNWWRKRKIRRAWCIICETTRSYCLI